MSANVRLAALLLGITFMLTACGGGGGGRSVLGGGLPGSGSAPQSTSGNVSFTLSIPGGGSSSTSSTVRHVATVSPQTASLGIVVNGGQPQYVNVTSSNCTGTTTLTCTITVNAPYGLDSFLITTYSGTSGGGSALNAAIVTLEVAQGTTTASATAGNIVTVTDSADASGASYSCASGSSTCTLREAIAVANSAAAGTTTAILFSGVSTIAITGGTINVTGNAVLIGPGASVANPPATGAPSASSGLTINGGSAAQVFYVAAGVNFTVSGLTFAGDNGSNGGGILNIGTLSVFNTAFTNNTVSAYGGGIYNQGSLTVVGSTFSGNTADLGGGIFDDGSAATTIAGSTFSNNTAEYGGAYYNESSSNATILASTFTGNTANNGGAYGGGLSLWGSGTVNVTSDAFTGNTSYEPIDGFADGGAIYVYSGTLNVASSTFTNNVAGNPNSSYSGGNTGYGGAISSDENGGALTITNSTFTGNYAGGPGQESVDWAAGGAVYNDTCSPITLSGNTFSGNKAQGAFAAYGGALTDFCGTLTSGGSGAPDTFSNNIADTSPCTPSTPVPAEASPCTGYSSGGAVQLEDVGYFTGATFSGNQSLGGATDNGESDAGGLTVCCADLTATNVTFTNNTSSDYDLANGGGLTAYQELVTLTNVQFNGNSAIGTAPASWGAAAWGGGMSGGTFGSGISVIFSGVTFSANTASTPQGGGYVLGGGLFEEFADEGGCESSCGRAQRPATYAKSQPAAATRLASTTFAARQSAFASFMSRQRALAAQRVAAHNAKLAARGAKVPTVAAATQPTKSRPQQVGTSSSLATVAFTSNNANAGAGGFALGGGASLSGYPAVTGASFSSNSATASGSEGFAVGGGLVYSDSEDDCGYMTFTGTITGNSAFTEGGGFATICESEFLQSTIASNFATNPQSAGEGGGGIWNEGLLELVQSTVSGNSVSGSVAGTGGGGIMNDDGLLLLADSTLYGNQSAIDGGGVENTQEAEVYFLNATVYANTAAGKGGSVDNENAGGDDDIQLANTILAGGSAPIGAEVANLDTFDSFGGNLIQGAVSGNAIPPAESPPNDLIGVNPQLAAGLTNNGGPTLTVADTANSPGKGYLPFSGGYCNNGVNLDQRNYSRGAGGVCDIGAYEFSGSPSSATISFSLSGLRQVPQALQSLMSKLVK